jgi:CRP-like cAMP-binding protein
VLSATAAPSRPGMKSSPAETPVDFSSVIVEGLACRQKVLRSGERQITAFHLSGDFCDLHTYLVKEISDSVMAMTPCQVAMVPHKGLDAITVEAPRLARLLWMSTLIDGAVYRRWLVCVGRQSAHSRLAHLFCELYMRMKLIGAAEGMTYPLPVTQTDLSDVMGMSLVHTNRTCALLRRGGLATFAHRTVTIHNWAKVQQVAEFDPGYLHLDRLP